jgi:toxin FitB
MIILDTNVVSALIRPHSNERVVSWLDRQQDHTVWTTAITVFELEFGFQLLPEGRRREQLSEELQMVLKEELKGRILFFDDAAAREAARLAADRQRQGRPRELRDTQIAGIALARRAKIATRNVRHFENLSVDVIDPWA